MMVLKEEMSCFVGFSMPTTISARWGFVGVFQGNLLMSFSLRLMHSNSSSANKEVDIRSNLSVSRSSLSQILMCLMGNLKWFFIVEMMFDRVSPSGPIMTVWGLLAAQLLGSL